MSGWKSDEFVAFDVETANFDYSSICQIGIVRFHDEKPVHTFEWLVNPEGWFDEINVSVHGISEIMVADAPIFPDFYSAIRTWLDGQIVACHSHFDRVALCRATEKYNLPEIKCTWLDTARVVRRAWPQFSQRGYGLKNVSSELGIQFRHHEAAEDAKASGLILLRAVEETGITVSDWPQRVKQPVHSAGSRISMEGNPEGPLWGENLVFTGKLSKPRRDIARLAAEVGCRVQPGVTKDTTILVVGIQAEYRLAGYKKSRKHRKAESCIKRGQQIRTMTEEDFLRLLEETR